MTCSESEKLDFLPIASAANAMMGRSIRFECALWSTKFNGVLRFPNPSVMRYFCRSYAILGSGINQDVTVSLLDFASTSILYMKESDWFDIYVV